MILVPSQVQTHVTNHRQKIIQVNNSAWQRSHIKIEVCWEASNAQWRLIHLVTSYSELTWTCQQQVWFRSGTLSFVTVWDGVRVSIKVVQNPRIEQLTLLHSLNQENRRWIYNLMFKYMKFTSTQAPQISIFSSRDFPVQILFWAHIPTNDYTDVKLFYLRLFIKPLREKCTVLKAD
jgi:hypothetical protein